MKSRIVALVIVLLPIGMLLQAQDPAVLRIGFVASVMRKVSPGRAEAGQRRIQRPGKEVHGHG